MLHIYIDADACPVKNEVYKVAGRYGLAVTLVANSYMRIPGGDVKLVVVDKGRDEADDWIADAVGARTTSWSPATSPWRRAAWTGGRGCWATRAGPSPTRTWARPWPRATC